MHTHSVASGGSSIQVSKNFIKENPVRPVIIYKTFGLGDLVEFFTKYTGVKWLIIKLTKGNCGCEERRKKWNIVFSVRFGKQHAAKDVKPQPKPTPKGSCKSCQKPLALDKVRA